jgi:hypothetical protein
LKGLTENEWNIEQYPRKISNDLKWSFIIIFIIRLSKCLTSFRVLLLHLPLAKTHGTHGPHGKGCPIGLIWRIFKSSFLHIRSRAEDSTLPWNESPIGLQPSETRLFQPQRWFKPTQKKWSFSRLLQRSPYSRSRMGVITSGLEDVDAIYSSHSVCVCKASLNMSQLCVKQGDRHESKMYSCQEESVLFLKSPQRSLGES